jgi:hypothetical protein
MVANHQFPDVDVFSHTAFMGRWVDNEWLGQLLFYGTWSLGGNTGLIVLRVVIFTLIFWLLRGYMQSARRPSMTLPAMVVAIALSYSWWELRPSVFSLVGMLALLIVLEGIRRHRLQPWLLPCLFLVWANLHPGFLFGLLVLAATCAAMWIEPLLSDRRHFGHDERLRLRLSGWFIASVVATLVNPYGIRVYSQQILIAGNFRYRELLDEWAPPSVAFLMLVLIAVGAFLLLRYRRVSFRAFVPILGAALLSTTGVRFEEYFALIAAPVMLANIGVLRRGLGRSLFLGGLVGGSLLVGLLPPMGSALQEGVVGTLDLTDLRLQERMWRNGGILAAVAGLSLLGAMVFRKPRPSVALMRLWRSGPSAAALALSGVALTVALMLVRPLPADGVEEHRYPDTCLSAVSPNNLAFNKLSWGGWLIWKAGARTYIDGRCWGQPIFFEYRDARGASGQEILKRRGIDLVILPPSEPVLRSLEGSGWKNVCTDGVSAVYALPPTAVARTTN